MARGSTRHTWTGVAPFFALALLLAAATLAGALRGPETVQADTAYDAEELRFLELINEYRSDNGFPALILSDALTLASERHSEDMGRYGFFAHNTERSSYFPDGSEPWDRMVLSGYDYPDSYRAENLAAGYETAEEAFQAWRESPGHNRNMLDGNQRVIGIARLETGGSEFGWYWTTDFGSEQDPTSHAPGEPSQADRQAAGQQEAQEQQAATAEQQQQEQQDGRKVQRRGVDRAGVENGAFGGAGVWRAESRAGGGPISDGVARLGGYDNAEDEISQRVRIGQNATLTYRVTVETQEVRHPADGLVVRLTNARGEHLVAVESHTDALATRGGTVEGSVDLSRFAGQNVRLAFLAKTDDARPTTFVVDDVRLAG